MRFLITGTAGFIGFHLALRLLEDGHSVFGLDGMTPYYNVELKKTRHSILARSSQFQPCLALLEDASALTNFGEDAAPEIIVHLAAQAGVRYSIENPTAYIDANLLGTFNVLELARRLRPRHLLIASTSSVYGANAATPFREVDRADHPLTLYAATKKSAELLAHSYSHLWKIPTTVLRFFTVYGPWGRPDMALFKFVAATLAGEPISIYGDGKMKRDFTYIDDLVEAMVRLINCVPEVGQSVGVDDSLSPVAPYRVVNIGGNNPTELLSFIEMIENCLDAKAIRLMMPMQPGDVRETMASVDLLKCLTDYRPSTPLAVGVARFVDWFQEYSDSLKLRTVK